jgi:hypothetical protein
MKKLFIGIVIFGFVSVFTFLGFACFKFYENFNEPKSAQELSDIAYYKIHGKEVGQRFLIDSVYYQVENFDYILNDHSAILKVDLTIKNQSNQPKQFLNTFFKLLDYNKLDYYPPSESFTVLKNSPQNIKLIYNLPEKMLPYIRYELHLNSQKNASQNALVILYKNYREGG